MKMEKTPNKAPVQTTHTVTDKVIDIAESAKNSTVQAATKIKEKATHVAAAVATQYKAAHIVQTANDTAHEVAHVVSDKAHVAYDATKKVVVEAGHKAQEMGAEFKDRASRAIAEFKKPAEKQAQSTDEVEIIEIKVPKGTKAQVDIKRAQSEKKSEKV